MCPSRPRQVIFRLQLQHWPALRAKTGFESQHGFSSNCIDQWGVMSSVNWPIVGGNGVTDRWRVNGNIKILFVMIWSCTMSGISVFYHRAFCFRKIVKVILMWSCFVQTMWPRSFITGLLLVSGVNTTSAERRPKILTRTPSRVWNLFLLDAWQVMQCVQDDPVIIYEFPGLFGAASIYPLDFVRQGAIIHEKVNTQIFWHLSCDNNKTNINI